MNTNEREPRYLDVSRYATAGYARTLVFKHEGCFPGEVSLDGRWLTLAQVNTTSDTECHVVDLKTGASKQLLARAGRVAQVSASDFTPDSKSLLVESNDGSEFSRILQVDLATGAATELEKADWDISGSYFSASCFSTANGRYAPA